MGLCEWVSECGFTGALTAALGLASAGGVGEAPVRKRGETCLPRQVVHVEKLARPADFDNREYRWA